MALKSHNLPVNATHQSSSLKGFARASLKIAQVLKRSDNKDMAVKPLTFGYNCCGLKAFSSHCSLLLISICILQYNIQAILVKI